MGRRGREKFGVGSASRRRTVLQIEPVSRRKENEGSHPISRKREINPTSISGIGLLGQYAENSDDEEQKSNSSGEENTNEEEQTKPGDKVQIDSKLSDFLKEIEAISTEDSKPTELSETTSESMAVDGAPLADEADASTVDQGYVLPAPWQEVCDPNTNYVYYWNTLTNEVSWELPPVLEPTQAQLFTVEQLAQNALPQQEVTGDNQDMSEDLTEEKSSLSDEETLHKDDTLQMTDSGDGKETVTNTCVADEQSESLLPIHEPNALPSASESYPSELVAKENTCSSPHDDLVDELLEESEQELSEATCKSREPCDSPKPESPTVSRKRERSAAIDMFESEARQEDENEDEGENILEYWDEDRIKNAVPEEMPECPPTPENLDVPPHSSSDEDQRDGDKLTAVDDEQEKEDGTNRKALKQTERSENEDTNGDEDDPETPAKKAKYESESDHESEGDFAEKLLEEFLEGKPADVSCSDDDMDVESDADEDVEEEPAPLLPPEAFRHNQADRLQEDGGKSPADISRSLVEGSGTTEEENEKLTTEIHDLCQILSNKLEFLNINKDGLNKLLIVLIQMETRIKDWREGGLSSSYIVKKLREAGEELRRYEQSAVPKGWSCHWDSTYKRYFYTNTKTGESKWEYPQTSTMPETSSVETKKVSMSDNVAAIGQWDTSINKETTSASYNLYTPSLEQTHLYPANTATYPVVIPSSAVLTTTAPGISSLEQTSETNYSILTSSLDLDAKTVSTHPVTAPTDVTKDPYRFDDDSPATSEDNREHGNTPPPPGSSPPPPPPADVQIVPPPPPPQDDVVNMIIPAPPPSVSENSKSDQVEQVNTAAEKPGVVQFQRSLVDYSDLESVVHLPNTKVQSSSSRSSPVPMQATTKQKKKKSKSSAATIRTSKVKQMSSLVQKWQAIKKQEEVLSEDESDEEDHAAKTEAQIQQWREEQITSGLAADNPNFQKITGDWRERVRKAKLRTAKTE